MKFRQCFRLGKHPSSDNRKREQDGTGKLLLHKDTRIIFECRKVGESAVIPVMHFRKSKSVHRISQNVIGNAPLKDVVNVLPRFVVLRMDLVCMRICVAVDLIASIRSNGDIFLSERSVSRMASVPRMY